MTQTIAAPSRARVQDPTREIVYRTRGRRHGPITRLMSPGDLGQVLKPFVFLDLFDTQAGSFSGCIPIRASRP
jgi:hypothetical protein